MVGTAARQPSIFATGRGVQKSGFADPAERPAPRDGPGWRPKPELGRLTAWPDRAPLSAPEKQAWGHSRRRTMRPAWCPPIGREPLMDQPRPQGQTQIAGRVSERGSSLPSYPFWLSCRNGIGAEFDLLIALMNFDFAKSVQKLIRSILLTRRDNSAKT